MSVPHRMLQDLLDQPRSIEQVLKHQSGEGRPVLERAAAAMRSANRIVITGMGASLYAAMPLGFHLHAAGRPALILEAGELLHFRSEVAREAVVVAVSRSGETVEIIRLLPRLREAGALVVGVTNESDSTLAREADVPVLVNSGRDEAVAAQTYTGTTTVALLLATLAAGRGDWSEAVAIPGLMRHAVTEEHKAVEDWAAFLRDSAVAYVLGRGVSIASAHEGALLLNETAKLPSVAMPVSGFRHGPVEVVDPAFRAVVFASDPRTTELDDALCSSLTGIGGQVRRIRATPGHFAPVIEIVPLQFAAYAAALDRGVTPGRFRYVSVVTTSETELGGNAG